MNQFKLFVIKLFEEKLFPNIIFVWSFFKYRILRISPEKSLGNFSQWVDMKNRVIRIKLNDLTHYVTKTADTKAPLKGHAYFCDRFIKGGDWDLNKRPIIPDYYDNHRWFRSTFQFFEQGLPLEDCDEYIYCEKKKRGRKIKKYEELRKLFKSLRTNGYYSQEELGKSPGASYKKNAVDEINVVIDRNGKFLRVRPAGNHRLAMAMILKLETIPVFIRAVHKDWALECYNKHNKNVFYAINKELDELNLSSK